MHYIGFGIIFRRIKALFYLLKDKTVPVRKKALVIFGIVYLFLPVDLIPPILFPFGFVDDLILWIYIIWHLKDELDSYWIGEKDSDLSKNFRDKNMVEGVEFNIDEEDSNEE